MEGRLRELDYDMVSGGTDTHLLLIDLKRKGIDGARVERILELVNVATNKNTVPGDKSALVPGGLRIGTPAMTSRGFKEADFVRVVDIIDRAVQIAKTVKAKVSSTKFADFKATLGNGENVPEIAKLKAEVVEWTKSFPVFGFDSSAMKYKD
jgi:glycine hydroxymethyltransferase